MVHPVVDSSGSLESLCRKKNIIECKFKYKTNKLTSISYVSVLFLMINCVRTFSKWLWNREPQVSGSALNFDNVLTKFIINKRTDTSLYFTITPGRAQNMVNFRERARGKLAANKDEWIR